MQTIDYFSQKLFSNSTLKTVFPQGCEWTRDSFFQRLNWNDLEVLKLPQEAVLSLPLTQDLTPTDALPDSLALLLEVFYDGKYSNDDYFTIDGNAEPATELLHGLEFATFLWHAGAPDEDMLGGLLHDIARFYTEPDHANKHHHTDGNATLETLFGADVGQFCLFHGLGKAHLYDAIADYPDGMTNVSMKTLVLQRTSFDDLYERLNTYKTEKDRQYVVLKAMFFRLFDDSSKYPEMPEFNLITREQVTQLMRRVYHKHQPQQNAIDVVVASLKQGLLKSAAQA